MKKVLWPLSLIICLNAHADRKDDIESFLRDFYDHPPKLRPPVGPSFERIWNPLDGIRIFEGIADDAELPRFLERANLEQISSLEQIQSRTLESSALTFSPWSDTYWPLYQGSLGARYADADYSAEGQGELAQYEAYISKPGNSLWEIADASSGDDPRRLTLSPAEKYDLLMGDRNSTLTKQVWRSALNYSRNGENPATWMGLCHGWAPASYREKRPVRKVEAIAADGVSKVTFFPSDIKGLMTLLWANAEVPMRMLGNRCNLDNPERHRGRLIAPECFDTNPAEWHLALVSQLGLKKQSMVIDATFDQQVWNQPVSKYAYDYFNPITRTSTQNLEEARVNIRDFTRDPFRTYRSRQARFLVGIALDLEYVTETAPNHADDGPASDRRSTVRYMYDLELDADMRIIGGEWYLDEHPDFIWTPSERSTAEAIGENRILATWDGQGPVPVEYSMLAARPSGSSRRGQPIAKIIRKLIEMSRTSE